MDARVLGIVLQILMMAVVFSIVILLLSIGVLVLIHICVVGRALRSLRSVEAHGGVPAGAAAWRRRAAADDCAICLETFQDGDRCRLLPVCRHSFHAQCVDSWLLKSSMCPICRSNVTGGSRRLSSMDAEGQIWWKPALSPLCKSPLPDRLLCPLHHHTVSVPRPATIVDTLRLLGFPLC
ncbi:unnamed protein product [Spirodela intermedia]|uniref:RING-type domain-containing protein n=1 Tax=Spirodela intermedia TaxID=51605 RepID=A0A7I8JSE7_SPIIN|nr:unnamed protein product [Spirodela intermedia]CAA6672493.1 unnamed protein product [Spirodela intermedia]